MQTPRSRLVPTAKPRISVVLDQPVLDQLTAMADAEGVSVSTLSGVLLGEALTARKTASGTATVVEQLRHVLHQLEAQDR